METSRKRPRWESDEGMPPKAFQLPRICSPEVELQQVHYDQAPIIAELSTEPMVCYGMVRLTLHIVLISSNAPV